jgi:hypothetical protein
MGWLDSAIGWVEHNILHRDTSQNNNRQTSNTSHNTSNTNNSQNQGMSSAFNNSGSSF